MKISPAKILITCLAGVLLLALTARADTTNFTTAGSFTWIVPNGVHSLQIECWGGGGAGGDARKVSTGAGGGGGGGGAYAKTTSVAVVPGSSYTVVVGGGGAHTPTGSFTVSGTAASGTNSWFGTSTTTNCLATAGAGGQEIFGSTGGTGGAGAATNGCIGGTFFSGGAGKTASTSRGGGGGGSAGTSSNGNAGGSGAINNGATAVTGGGAGGAGNIGGNGSNGGTPGGGGGGGEESGGTTIRAGGDGAAGQVILTYTVSYDHVNVETAADGSGTTVPAQSVSSGSSITVYAIARESDGTYIANVASTWSLTNKTGSVADSDLVASGDAKSAVFTAHLGGSAQIKAVFSTVTANLSGVITVPSTGTVGAWAVDANGNWTDATKWSSNPSVPSAAGDTAIFGVASALRTITLDANETIGTISFTNANSFVVSGANTLTLDKSGSGALIQVTDGSANAIQTPVSLNDNASALVSSGKSLAISGTVSSTAGQTLTVNGAGTLSLSGNNSYGPSAGSVGTTLSGGTLKVGNNNALGAGDLNVTANSTLQSGAAGLSLGNNITVASLSSATIDNNGNNLTLSGIISGGGNLVKTGNGTLTLGGINSYNGSTTVAGGALSLSADNNVGATPGSETTNVVLNGGSLVGTAAFSLSSTRDIGIGSSVGSVGTNAVIDAAAGQSFTVSGAIGSAGNTGVNGLIVNQGAGNNGTVILSGANTFNGQTYITKGALQLANSAALQNSVLDYTNTSGNLLFDVSITAATIGDIMGTRNLALTNLNGAGVTLTLGNDNGSVTYPANFTDDGIISGTAGLGKTGSGTLTLAGTNLLNGNVGVSSGTIQIPTNGVMAVATISCASASSTPQLLVNGGSLLVSNASSVVTASGTTGILLVSGGSANFNSGLSVNAANSSQSAGNCLASVTGGSLMVSSLTLGRGGLTTTTQPTAGQTTQGLYVNGGTVNITNNISMGTMSGANSGTSLRVDSGSLTVGGSFTFGHNNSGRWSVVDFSGGTVTINDTNTGINVGSSQSGNAVLLIRGGTTTVGKIGLGNSANTVTNVVTAAINQTNGSLYIGAGGIVQMGDSTNTAPSITLGGGILGATADWTCTNGMTLGGTAIQAADAGGTPHNILLTGAIGGTGALTKTGNGTLTLNSVGNFYTGGVALNAGTLNINSTWQLGGGVYGGFTFNGGTLQYAATLLNGAVDITHDTSVDGTNGVAKNVTFASTATIDVNGNAITYANGVGNGGNGGLIVQSTIGGGILNLLGANNYTGNTTVKSGTLQLGVSSLYTNSTVSVSNGAVLSLNFTGTNRVTALVLNGVSQTNGIYGSSTPGGFITGTGYIQVGSLVTVPPAPAHLTNSISGSTLTLTWPAGQGWTLTSQTNSLSSGLNTNAAAWLPVAGGIDGSNSIIIDPTKPTVFYRLKY